MGHAACPSSAVRVTKATIGETPHPDALDDRGGRDFLAVGARRAVLLPSDLQEASRGWDNRVVGRREPRRDDVTLQRRARKGPSAPEVAQRAGARNTHGHERVSADR